MRRNNSRPEKLHQALELLNDAAREKREELYDALEHQYEDIRHIIEDTTEKGRRRAENIRRRAEETISAGRERAGRLAHETAEEVDRRVHDNPWPFFGGIALTAFLAGITLSSGRRRRKRD